MLGAGERIGHRCKWGMHEMCTMVPGIREVVGRFVNIAGAADASLFSELPMACLLGFVQCAIQVGRSRWPHVLLLVPL